MRALSANYCFTREPAAEDSKCTYIALSNNKCLKLLLQVKKTLTTVICQIIQAESQKKTPRIRSEKLDDVWFGCYVNGCYGVL